jgi:hypothetical protein
MEIWKKIAGVKLVVARVPCWEEIGNNFVVDNYYYSYSDGLSAPIVGIGKIPVVLDRFDLNKNKILYVLQQIRKTH